MLLVSFIIRVYHDALSPECQIWQENMNLVYSNGKRNNSNMTELRVKLNLFKYDKLDMGKLHCKTL